jgi:large subunit ribosomal protein L31
LILKKILIIFKGLKFFDFLEAEMKANIHPSYDITKVTCACGNTFETRSTLKEIKVEICSHCHPFYSGKQKLIDTAGRVDKYYRKYNLKPQNQ